MVHRGAWGEFRALVISVETSERRDAGDECEIDQSTKTRLVRGKVRSMTHRRSGALDRDETYDNN